MEAKLLGATKPIHINACDDIDKSLVTKTTIRTKTGCGRSGLDADKWRGTLGSNQFGSSSFGLKKSFSRYVEKLTHY